MADALLWSVSNNLIHLATNCTQLHGTPAPQGRFLSPCAAQLAMSYEVSTEEVGTDVELQAGRVDHALPLPAEVSVLQAKVML